MKIEVEISTIGDYCNPGCRFLAWSGMNHICRAFAEPSKGTHCNRQRSVRVYRDDFLRFERCQQCKDAQVPNV